MKIELFVVQVLKVRCHFKAYKMYLKHIFESKFMFLETTGRFWCDGSHLPASMLWVHKCKVQSSISFCSWKWSASILFYSFGKWGKVPGWHYFEITSPKRGPYIFCQGLKSQFKKFTKFEKFLAAKSVI